MKIIADENMPFAEQLFQQFGEVQLVNGRTVTAEQVNDADLLLVRSVTKVNSSLIAGAKKLKFVGTATIGMDHIDQSYLALNQIPFSNAPGCNAIAVGEFAFIAMLELAHRFKQKLKNKTVGIVGVGNTGSALERCLNAYGVKTLLCDPIKATENNLKTFVSLEDIIEQCDVISLHVPLTKEGEHKTESLLDEQKLNRIKKNAWLLNCCRGEVIDNLALFKVKQHRSDLKIVLDVWANEPNPMEALIPYVEFATPHIAGYSVEGKARGTFMLYQKVCELLGQKQEIQLEDLLPQFEFSHIELNEPLSEKQLLRLARFVYDLRDDDELFRKLNFANAEFDEMRKSHQHRREFSALSLKNCIQSELNWLSQLGFSK
ncbi:erythronate-4-phosphate dehydrogenase [Shewanella sp. OPT22]|nr:erythronate-4-phosphate dehydrogenase [Shewanella sp. OPT22]